MDSATYVVSTMDTKGLELAFVAEALRRSGVIVKMVDAGTLGPPTIAPDISREAVLCARYGQDFILNSIDRGTAIAEMAEALRAFLLKECAAKRVQGVIGLGGSGGTSLITTGFRN